MVYKLTIKNLNCEFILQEQEIINLELKLNLTEYGNKWIHIGDYLFNFYHKNQNKTIEPILNVSSDQYKVLFYLHQKKYDEIYSECRENLI